MLQLTFEREFEIVIVEDGSSQTSEKIIEDFRNRLKISYHYKINTGPGDSRNYGMKRAEGNYFLILDSDVVLPENYLKEVDSFLRARYVDGFGGPDAAHESFSKLQKAINYSMTSLFTTGGIRGKEKSVDKFQPRSFNMGLSKKAFEATGGFGRIHPGEDPDLSLRLWKQGFETVLIPSAVVYHRRRIDWGKFYKQVYKFGLVRPVLNSWHPGSAKITYWFPTVFTAGLLVALLLLLTGFPYLIILYFFYFLLIGLDAGFKNKSFYIGGAAILAALIQFTGYGYGFFKSFFRIEIVKEDPESAFPGIFFKNGKKE